jgi:hypothetical protein
LDGLNGGQIALLGIGAYGLLSGNLTNILAGGNPPANLSPSQHQTVEQTAQDQ